jgi:DNA polymerase-3 subunit epsilon
MILRLSRPLVFLDFETTGLDIQSDRIVELAFVRLLPDGSRQSLVQRVNPGKELSAAAAKVNGIENKLAVNSLFGGPPLKKVSQRLVEFLADSDLAGFNTIGFDVPLWQVECKRHGIDFRLDGRRQVDAKVIFNVVEKGWDRFLMGPRNLSAAVRHFCGREHDGAHAAENDCNATVDVLLAQLQRYPDLPRDVPGLHEFCARNGADEEDDTRARAAAAQ